MSKKVKVLYFDEKGNAAVKYIENTPQSLDNLIGANRKLDWFGSDLHMLCNAKFNKRKNGNPAFKYVQGAFAMVRAANHSEDSLVSLSTDEVHSLRRLFKR